MSALASVALAACGGGGSSGTSASASSAPATSASQPIAEPGATAASTTASAATPAATTASAATPAATTASAATPAATAAPVTTPAAPAPAPAPAATAAVLTFSAVDYSIAQSTKAATVVVNRSGTASNAISVQYATADGSGVAGSLYTATTGTLQWAANDTAAKSISVPVSNTAPFAGVKSFKVALTNPSADASVSSPGSATVTVAGDAAPASVQLSAAAYTVVQNAGSLSITAARSGGSTGAISVSYATADGTAVAGKNYSSTSGMLNWAANDASIKTFTVAISNAAAISTNLTFSVSLSAPGGGAVLGSTSTAAVTITPAAQTSGSAANILAYLGGLNQGSGHRVLSGQHASIWNTPLTSATAAMDVVTPLAGETGQNPAILGLVLNYATDSYAFTVDVTNTLANQWWAKGGLVMLSLYDNDPTFSFNTSGAPIGQAIPSSAFHQLTVKGSAAYTQWHSQLDTYAAALHALTDSGHTVLFRPFIELNGNWNWYGAENPADFIAVWQDMYTYMMVTKGLKNVLWIYNVNQNVGNYTAYYPGASYVDIVGLDIYASPSQFVQYGNAGNAYASLKALGKPLILPEVGLGAAAPPNNTVDDTTLINDIRNSFPDIVAFVDFNGGWSICNQNNASALMNDPWIVDLSGLPSGF